MLVEGKEISAIGVGIVTLLGIESGDNEMLMERVLRKIANLRIFPDETGKMNRSLLETGGSHLIVSQFTLFADTSQGRRPSFLGAEKPERARDLYDRALGISQGLGVPTKGGIFQADMRLQLENDGPVTIILEEKQ